jgi:hypothetical protein
MSTSGDKYDAIENLIFSEKLIINSVAIDKNLDRITCQVSSGNSMIFLIVPISHYKKLKDADESALRNYRLIAGKTGIHWPDLDEDLSLKGFLKEYLKQKVHTEKELIIA